MANLSNINGKFVVEQTTGYVGVGTTDPSYPIEVLNASAEIALNASGSSIYILRSDSTDSFRIIKNDVGDRLVIDSSGNSTFTGNVTANTGSKITSSSADTTFSIETTSGTTIFPVLDFVTSHSSVGGQIRQGGTKVIGFDKSLNSTFAGSIMVNGDGIDIDNNDNLRLRFDNASVFKAGLQVATSTGDMITSSVTNDFAIRSQSNMLFATGGSTERMRIDSNGFTSITTNGAGASLTLGQGGGISINENVGYLNFYSKDGSATSTGGVGGIGIYGKGAFTGNTPTYMSFYTHGASPNDGSLQGNVTEQMRIDFNGNVGIGTDSPQVPLQIGTHITTAPADTGLTVSNRKSIRINDADGNYNFGVYIKQNYSGNSYLILGTRHNAIDTDALFVKNGNVGIGTDSPTSSGSGSGLDVSGMVVVRGTLASHQTNAGVLERSGDKIALRAYGATAGSGYLAFNTGGGGGSADTERMRITSAGDVGINEIPAYKFDVNDEVTGAYTTSNPQFVTRIKNKTNDGTINSSFLSLQCSSDNGGSNPVAAIGVVSEGTSSNNGACVISTRSGGGIIERLRVTSGGYLKSPQTYNLTTADTANMHVDTHGFFYRSTSSLKYKTDVKDYDKGLNEVMQLQPKYYKGINDGDTQFAGLIAEDVHDLGLTEFVQYADDGSPDALSYSHMIALLTKAIQELKADNDSLKARIETLENN